MTDCVIIGGGISGLAAAVRLVERGRTITLFEAKPRLGGRTFSFFDNASGETLDNGQHIMMGCYTSTLSFLRAIGVADDRLLRIPLDIPYLHADGRRTSIRAVSLPFPINNLGALLGFKMLNMHQRLSVLRIAKVMIAKNADDETRGLSVQTWLIKRKQDDETIEYLWAPIVLATMNAAPEMASAQVFLRVLREVFLGGKTASTVILPASNLDETLIDPAANFIRAHGGVIRLHEHAEQLVFRDDGSVIIRTSQDATEARSVIPAVPPAALSRILERSGLRERIPVDAVAFENAPIVSVHVLAPVQLARAPMLGLLGSPLHWLFSKGQTAHGLWRYSCTISAATALVDANEAALRRLITTELRRFFPSLAANDIVLMKIVKERAATFVPRPGIEAYRPTTRTSIPNFFLAGDWTDTGLPATIEGAVRSGEEAGEEVLGMCEVE